jgi:hypothetical protein
MLANAIYLEYDIARYPFAAILEREVFNVRPLADLHRFWGDHKRRSGGDGSLEYRDNLALRGVMQRLPDDSSFRRLYHAFVRHEIAPHYGRTISYSNGPKMRVHLAGTPSVSAWHHDVAVTHRPEQINVFLPFTDCCETNALWCESDYGRGDYQPVPLVYGQALLFDGGYLSHGSVPNRTNATRVSLDFRFAPKRSVERPWCDVLAGRPSELAQPTGTPMPHVGRSDTSTP